MNDRPSSVRYVVLALPIGAAIIVTAFVVDGRTAAMILAAIGLVLIAASVIVLQPLRGRSVATVHPALSDGGDDRLFAAEPVSVRADTHPVSGLPVREALLAQINTDGRGLLGAIAFADFDRLTAFDPSFADEVFAAAVARLRAMLPRERFVAQVDRGQVGLWFGPGVSEPAARAELDAIAYSLGGAIEVAGQSLTPQVKVRLATFDAAAGIDAGAFVARTLASFALVAGMPAAAGQAVDYSDFARDRYAIEQDLRQAIARRELRLDYQPLVDAGAGRVSGAEALIRWDHAEHGAIPPTRFIPIVEAMGLASEIGMWALNTAARQANEWRASGLGNLRVAVNVSGLQLERDDLPILVQRTLERHDLSPTALEIELTESVATSNADHCRRIFESLRAMGVKLAVDDFGTGYSGFSSLRTLAFDKIKIDREFITDVDTRADSQAICQSIIALGRGLGIRVLAEGIERRQEYEWLRRHGCRHFQGYYFGRPMSGDAFAAFVRDGGKLETLLAVGGPAAIEERLRA